MQEERMRILKMVADGKITPEQAEQLIEALEKGEPEQKPASTTPAPRWFKVQVTDTRTGNKRVNLRLPLAVVRAGSRIGSRFVPEMSGLSMDDILEAIQEGESGRVVEVADDESGERVVISIE